MHSLDAELVMSTIEFAGNKLGAVGFVEETAIWLRVLVLVVNCDPEMAVSWRVLELVFSKVGLGEGSTKL